MSYTAKFYNSACQTAFSKENGMYLSILKILRLSAAIVKDLILMYEIYLCKSNGMAHKYEIVW